MRKTIKLRIIYILTISSLIGLNACEKEDHKSDSDNLTGTWNVTETVSGSSTTYSATITKKPDNVIMISSARTNPPPYYVNDLTVTVKWADKKIEKSGASLSGTIANGNDFEIQYMYGTSGTLYSVSQHYTR